MEIKTNAWDLRFHLTNEQINLSKRNDSGIVVLTIPEKTTNSRDFAIEIALALLKKDNQHLKITAIGFTPYQNGVCECIVNFEEKG